MFYYAQIDANGVCFSVGELSTEVISDNMISIGAFDASLLGKIWNGSTWIAPA